jgi:hypothetical protein
MTSWKNSVGSSVVRPHVPEDELHAYCDGELSPAQRVEIAEHLLGCLICRSLHAEVDELRTRTSSLLAMAAPRAIRRPVVPQVGRQFAARRWNRITGAAAAAVIGVGVWFSLQPEQAERATTHLAAPGATPGLFGYRGGTATAARAARGLRMSAAITNAPTVLGQPGIDGARTGLVSPVADVDPIVTNDWTETTWIDALQASNGSLAHIAGLPVTSVRMHTSTQGGRPTFMIRQKLADGRPVWVFEGLVDDITPVNQVLEASGVGMSMALRTRGDYIGTDRTVRMMTVVGNVPVDSLNALMKGLRLK